MAKSKWLVATLAAAVLAIVLYAGFSQPSTADAAQVAAQSADVWQYGFLENRGGNAGYSFTVGDDILGRNGTSIDNLIRLIDRGWRGLPTEANLWNALGNQGWELAWDDADGFTGRWVFKRQL